MFSQAKLSRQYPPDREAVRQSGPMTGDDFRELALGMQEAEERAHMGHPDFRANGRIFATLHSDDRWGMVKLAPEEQHELMRRHPGVFVPSSGAWGRQGCTNVRLEAADASTVRGAILLAWERARAMPPVKSRTAPKRSTPRSAPR
jgi:hypothetical protein